MHHGPRVLKDVHVKPLPDLGEETNQLFRGLIISAPLSLRRYIVIRTAVVRIKYFGSIKKAQPSARQPRPYQRMGSFASSLKRLHTHAARHKSCSSRYEKIFSTTSSGSFSCKYCSAGAAEFAPERQKKKKERRKQP